MHIKSILSSLLVVSILAAPLAQAAPKKKKGIAKNTTQQKPAASTHFPPQHEADYQKFIEKLRELTQQNSFDLSPALFIIFEATGDEFSIEQWMQRAADEGEPAAILFIALKHLINVPEERYRSPEILTAVTQLKKASDSKYVPAMVAYSKCLNKGIGTSKNEAAAEKLLIAACSSGSYEPRFEWLLMTGRLEKYEDLQRPEVKAEMERGNHYIAHHMSINTPNDAILIRLLVQAAEKGNKNALFELSELHIDRDLGKSYKLLTLAVKARNPDALYRMGMYMIDPPVKLEINVGPVKDVETGVKMLKMAAILGQNDARMQLALMYLNGKNGQPKDADRAYRHISTGAVLSGNPVLLAAQGFMMLQGIGTKQDTQNGLKLIQAAAARGYTHAKALLGYAHYRGLGVEKSVTTAVMHLEDATSHKDPFAFIYLALLYDEEKQPEKSKYYLEHAERVMPGKATIIFNFYKQNYKGWYMTPFPL